MYLLFLFNLVLFDLSHLLSFGLFFNSLLKFMFLDYFFD